MYEHEKFFKSRRTKVTPATCVEGIARGSRSRSQQGHGSALRRSLSHRFCSEKGQRSCTSAAPPPAPRWPHPETQAPGSTRGVPRASRTRHAALPRESAGSGPGNSPQKKALDSPRECERQSGHPATALPGAWAASSRPRAPATGNHCWRPTAGDKAATDARIPAAARQCARPREGRIGNQQSR